MGLAFLALPSICFATDYSSVVTLEDGSVIGRSNSGQVVWQQFAGAPGGADSQGAPNVPRAALPASAQMPSWDSPPTTLDPEPNSYVRGPIFDSLGNAWVVIANAENLIAIQSNGNSGAWNAPHIIGPALPTGIDTVGVAVDQSGGFYVTYGTETGVSGTPCPLMYTKYSPNGGWQASTTIFSSTATFGETFPYIDSQGRVVVVFNANGVSSIASSPDQSTWNKVQKLTPQAASVLLPSVGGNQSGSRLVLVYLRTGFADAGLQYALFDSDSGAWGSFSPIPGADNATFSFYGGLSAYPIAVDESGNITLATAAILLNSRLRRTYTIAGYRYEAGQWSINNLTQSSPALPTIDNLASISLNPNGSVLIATALSDGQSGSNITVFRYVPGQGWDTEVAAHSTDSVVYRCAIAWFESTEAELAYTDLSVPNLPLQAVTYVDGVWSSGPMPPGTLDQVVGPRMGNAPTGEALLVAPVPVIATPGVFATWLRP
jgi:hypothetical protein